MGNNGHGATRAMCVSRHPALAGAPRSGIGALTNGGRVELTVRRRVSRVADEDVHLNGEAAAQRKYWVGFGQTPYIGPTRLRRLIEHFGDVERAWTAPAPELQRVLDERSAESLLRTRGRLSLDGEMERIERVGIEVLTIDDPSYPRLLAQIPSPPPVLYVRGRWLPEDDLAIAIVGTRRSTSYGREVTARIANDLAAAGVTVVSGLARGIDGVAHNAALKAGGRTVAVLGSGVDIIYPSEHHQLAERIIECGALISDYPPGRKPDAPNFPARNRIISGLSLGVVVVEAPNRSGALITVDFAADQGREVFVVPGSVLSENSAGCHRLLRDGARPVTCADDILDDLRIGQRKEQVAVQQALPLTDPERRLLNHINADPQHIDEIIASANLAVAEGLALISMLELKGMIRDAGARHFVRA
jgi:DNA processing protein